MPRSITIDGLSHGNNPVPAAAVIGNLLMSGAIFGTDPATGKLAVDAEAQCSFMFAALRRVLQAAGADFQDVLKLTFFMQPDLSRDILNAEWVKAYPDSATRPARHVIVNDRLAPTMLIQCDVFAVIPGPTA